MEYQHGGDIYSHEVELDFSANINPLGLPEGVKNALTAAIDHCSCYPDSKSRKLIERLEAFHSLVPGSVICGNGAADLIFSVIRAVKPRRAVLAAPSFLEYEQALHTVDCEIAWFELTEKEDAHQAFRLQGEAYRAFLDQEEAAGRPVELIFLCNPNNPTGLTIDREDMVELLDSCEAKGIFCVVDECFAEFLDTPDSVSIMEDMAAGRWKHVFLLKAFTKIYAMAGVRLGYGICCDEALLLQMEEGRQPWSVSGLAQAAGEAALLEEAYVLRTRTLIAKEREYMRSQLTALGFRVYDSRANYLFFRDENGEAGSLYHACLEKKVLLRSCHNYRGLDGTYYRICIRKRQDHERLLQVLLSIDEERRRQHGKQRTK